ncbi:MAG: CBS domain-containing protein [Brevinematia bacterium]
MVLKNITYVKAKDIMTTDFFVCKEDFNLFLAIDKILRKKVHSIVVVDENKKVKDIISATDLLKIIFLDYKDYQSMKISEISRNREIIYIKEDTDIVKIVKIMKEKGISTIIVLNDMFEPIGIVHIKDVLKVLEQIYFGQ